MQTLGIIAVVLFAAVVGAAIPALVQLQRTLRSAQAVLDRTGPKIDRIATDAAQAIERLNRVSAGVEEIVGGLHGALDAVADLSRAIRRLRDHLQTAIAVVAALGPAVSAGARALFQEDGDAPGAGGHRAAGGEEGGVPAAPAEHQPGVAEAPGEEVA